MDDPKPLNVVVRDSRNALGISQEELAERVGKSQEWVSKIESGEIKFPRQKTLERMAFALRVSLTDLLIAAGFARTKADAARLAASPSAGSDRTLGDRVDESFDSMSAGERSAIEAIVRSHERNKRQSL